MPTLSLDPDECCSKSELELFHRNPTQMVAETAKWVSVEASGAVENGGPLEFNIYGGTEEYIDLNDTILYLEAKVMRLDAGARKPLDGEDIVAPVNNFMDSLFKDAALILRERQIESANQLYPYKAIMATHLQFAAGAKRTQLISKGYLADDAGQLETKDNTAFGKRAAWIAGSRLFQLCGPLMFDFFAQQKYLLNQVNVTVKLARTDPTFSLLRFEAVDAQKPQRNYIIVISKAVLMVRKVKVFPEVAISHALELKNGPALYQVQHTEMVQASVSSGLSNYTYTNLFKGQLPKLVIMGMVENEAVNGTLTKHPFNFQHFDVNKVALVRDSQILPQEAYEPHFAEGRALMEYLATFTQLEMFNRNETHDITYEQFCKGYTLFLFNLAADLALAGHCQPYRDGNLQLHLSFAKPLPKAINIIVMGVFDGRVEIDHLRDAHTDFKSI